MCGPICWLYEGHADRERLMIEAEKVLIDNGVAQDGDLVVFTMGEPIGQSGEPIR